YPFEVLVKLDQWTKVRDSNGEVAWVENAAFGSRATVLVTVPLADVRAQPNVQSPLVFEAYKQVILEVLEPAQGEWIKVRHRAARPVGRGSQPTARAATGPKREARTTSASRRAAPARPRDAISWSRRRRPRGCARPPLSYRRCTAPRRSSGHARDSRPTRARC